MLTWGNLNSFCVLRTDITTRIIPNASSIRAVIRKIHPSKVFGMVYPKEGFDLGV